MLRTRPIPGLLAKWLEIVNGVAASDDISFRLYLEIEPHWAARSRGTLAERERRIEGMRAQTRDWAPATLAYVFAPDDEGNLEPGNRLTDLVIARAAFREIARQTAEGLRHPIPVTGAELVIDHMGVVTVRLVGCLQALQGVAVDRIRVCPRCSKLFWAGRRDKSGCSEGCARVLRQGKLRERLRKNRAYKQRLLSRKKEKRNG